MRAMLIDAILSLVPGAEVVVRGDGPDAEIEWHSPSVAPVTREQIDAELERLLALPEPEPQSPVEKLKAFLAANPDVRAILD